MRTMVTSLWLSFLPIPEIYRLRLISKSFDDYITNHLYLCDVTLSPGLLRANASGQHPLNDSSHPLYQLLYRSSLKLRSLYYRPDLDNAGGRDSVIRRPLDFLSLRKCYAIQFRNATTLQYFRSDIPLIPSDLLASTILPRSQFSLRKLSVLVTNIQPSATQSSTSSPPFSNAEDNSPDFPLLESCSIVVCPASRMYRAKCSSPLGRLVSQGRFPKLKAVEVSGQDHVMALAFHEKGLQVRLYEPRLTHMSQIHQLMKTKRVLQQADPCWNIKEVRNIRLYYILKMLQFLGAGPKTSVDRLVLAVTADNLSQLIPHLLHIERTHATGPDDLSTPRPGAAVAAMMDAVFGELGAERPPAERREALPTQEPGAGLMKLDEILVLRDESSHPLFLGTVEHFAVDVVEAQRAGNVCTNSLQRIHMVHNQVLALHQRHFLENSWMPHVFLQNLS
eukprot:Blabericola_migrator_1__6520@NODE_328_length_9722_cov_325_367582_g265_i0_p3_GENE_NODE_328_length_9722_cov_325_367582_g265_i0NODE_328_length_9722_cov_325_367582_g265_i0_p3_ORF_typecomplete_len449_score63_87_NODE_328_length_9722_cov_325_367582_g265_i082079553